ncbi:MAG: hypothetical protein JW751_24310 [Polyangiaceae bacterium]|nr:hypothetical protein [Polyangiaceae bacterium]
MAPPRRVASCPAEAVRRALRPARGAPSGQGGTAGCAATEALCGTDCVNLATDDDHCGSCSNSCHGADVEPGFRAS